MDSSLLADKMSNLSSYVPLFQEASEKNRLRPWKVKSWCLPVRYNSKSVSTAKFVDKMEDVLSVYERPYDPDYPVVCIDEKSKELRGHTPGREPVPPRPSPSKEEARDQREDYEYKRGGMSNLFMVCEPLRGWRRVRVTNQRTAQDFAYQVEEGGGPRLPASQKGSVGETSETQVVQPNEKK